MTRMPWRGLLLLISRGKWQAPAQGPGRAGLSRLPSRSVANLYAAVKLADQANLSDRDAD